VEDRVFEVLPTVCFGVVVAEDLRQEEAAERSLNRLRQAEEKVRSRMAQAKPKDHPEIACYREAFRKLGFNPNKFTSSVEALVSRVVKGACLPDINPVVNAVNAVSLEFLVPMGAHDLDRVEGDIEVRFARPGEIFIPFGETEPEEVEPGELVYADAKEVRTRRWIWRQGNNNKVTEASRRVFFPIDGFEDVNREAVRRARDELAGILADWFKARVKTFYLNAEARAQELGLEGCS
jgi:DNA/RNA-binding domain of Phe-tRNA-synthetase-like protein